MTLKISIIIPVYNSVEYLEECLDSVVSQEYTNLEIILIDDGSTDQSFSVCESYAKRDNRIILIQQENGGLGCARNSGLDKVTGDYIAFVDSDDTISKDLFSEAILSLESNKAVDILQFPVYMHYGVDYAYIRKGENCIINSKELLFKSWIEEKRVSWMVCDKLFKKEVFSNLRFVKSMIYEDNYLMVSLLSNSKSLIVSTKGLYYYHSRVNSLTTSQHSLKKELDTQKVSLHILDSVKELKNFTKGRVILLSRILNVYQSMQLNFNHKNDIDNLFIKELKGCKNYAILKSSLPFLQKVKLIIVKVVGVRWFLKKNT